MQISQILQIYQKYYLNILVQYIKKINSYKIQYLRLKYWILHAVLGVPLFIEQLAETFGGCACYGVFDLFVAFDQRLLAIQS